MDVGCGTGEHVLYLALRGHDAWGVDLAPLAIDLARHKAAERNIQVAIQSVLDICNHAVADMKLEVPDEEKQAFQILASHKMIPARLAKTLTSMAGMRNVLVHEYLEVDHARLYAVMRDQLGDFEKLIRAILKLL